MAVTALRAIQAFDYERRVLKRWAWDCARGDKAEVNRLCGLTPAGSPPTIMGSLYALRDDAETTGYAKDLPPPPDTDVLACHAFISAIRILRPTVHECLLARHRRLIQGEFQLIRSDVGIARKLYPELSRGAAHARLDRECELGYAALREWLGQTRT